MIYRLNSILSVFTGLAAIIVMMSCEEDTTTIGVGVINESPLRTDVEVFDVFAYNQGIDAVQANKLPIYQLGNYMDPVYGNTEARITTQVDLAGGFGNPTFGNLSQAEEDNADSDGDDTTVPENEVVTEVFLYIPFLQNPRGDRDLDGVVDDFDVDPENPNSDSDGDGVSDSQETTTGTDPLNPDTDGDGIDDDEDLEVVGNTYPKQVDLDSIYGDRDVPFNLKVERSTFFLRDLDPSTGFLEAQEYFSSQQFSPGFVADVFFEGEVTITTQETITFKEDDPDTEIDESLEVDQRLQPGIRVPLDIDFFQQNIIDNEGKSPLLSSANFVEFFRGIHLSVSDDVLMLLDLTDGNITISYEFDAVDEEGEDVKLEDDYVLTLITGGGDIPITGNAINTFANDALPADIASQLDTGENASRIYVKGGSGTFAEIQLFEPNNEENIINQIKANNWIINEANLVFYVDRDALDAAGTTEEANRLYLYNAETNRELYNINFSNAGTLVGRIDDNYGGSLEVEGGQGVKYKIKITNYINDIIVRDSVNATLGLAVTADITDNRSQGSMLESGTEKDLPLGATITPLSTVLIGSNVPADDNRKLRLEIFFTETD